MSGFGMHCPVYVFGTRLSRDILEPNVVFCFGQGQVLWEWGIERTRPHLCQVCVKRSATQQQKFHAFSYRS